MTRPPRLLTMGKPMVYARSSSSRIPLLGCVARKECFSSTRSRAIENGISRLTILPLVDDSEPSSHRLPPSARSPSPPSAFRNPNAEILLLMVLGASFIMRASNMIQLLRLSPQTGVVRCSHRGRPSCPRKSYRFYHAV